MLKISKFSGERAGKMVITAKINLKVIYIFLFGKFDEGRNVLNFWLLFYQQG